MNTGSGTAPRTRVQYAKAILVGSVGNMIEWYDWFIYSTFAVYFSGQFFSAGDRTSELLSTMAIFAVGFLARPLGGWVLGRVSDRKGRKAGLSLTVSIMSLSALMIAAAPSYAVAGHLGAVILVIARIMQGLSVGGEYAASASYLTEVSASRWRGFGASFQYVSVTLGQLAGLGMLIVLQLLLDHEQLTTWGWRIPFVVAAIGAIWVFYLRRGMHETTAYRASQHSSNSDRHGTLAEVWRNRRAVFLVFALTMGGSVAYYTYTTYLTSYLINSVGLSPSQASTISFIGLCVFLVLLPVGGFISDVIGRRPVLIFFGVGATLGTYPILSGMQRWPSWGVALTLTLVALTIIIGYSSVNAAVKAELFPTGVRTLGVALPYNIAQAIFGGTAAYIALAFREAGHESWFFLYVSGCALVSLITYLLMPETRHRDLVGTSTDSTPPVTENVSGTTAVTTERN